MSDEQDLARFQEMMKRARVTKQVNPETGQEMDVLGVDFGFPGREHVRTRRCQNCMAYDTSEHAKAHFRHCEQRDRKTMSDNGKSTVYIENYISKLRRTILGNMKSGKVGYCLRRSKRTDGAATHDFSTADYLCDEWIDAVGIDTNAHPISADPLIEEVYDKMGEAPPSVEQAEEDSPEDS